MKKKVTISLLIVLSLFLTACGKVELKDGNEVIVETEKGKITVNNLYDQLKEQYGLNLVLETVDTQILESLYKDKTAEKEFVNSKIDELNYYYESAMKEQYSSFEDFITNAYGFKNEAALRDYFSVYYKKEEATKDYAKTVVTDKEIKKYYDDETIGEMRASHILIIPDYAEGDDDETKEKAKTKALEQVDKILKELEEGKDFGELAKNYSQDGSAANGGDLGYLKKGEMVEPFENAVLSLKNKEYTKKAVESEFGYHIILKTGQKEKEKLTDLKEEIVELLATEKIETDELLGEKALIHLRTKYGIVINDKDLKKKYNSYVTRIKG